MEAEPPKPAESTPSSAGEGTAPGSDERSPETSLSWPPPGLGGSQGEAWSMLAVAGVGGALLAFPLLWAIARAQPFWSMGPFGRPWWILPITSLAGLAVLGNFFWRLFLLLRASAKGADRGYGIRMLLQVAADGRGDTGFLLQGARYYSGLGSGTRRGLLNLRLWGVYLYLAGALWVPIGCALSLILAARGVFSTSGVWMVTLAPAGILAVAGMACRTAEETTVRKARRRWFAARSQERELEEEVEDWNRSFLERQPPEGLGIGDRGAGGSFRRARWGVVLVALVIAVPSLTLAATTLVGPVVGSVALPQLPAQAERLAAVESYRRLQVEKDPEISPVEAGEALNALIHVGREGPRTDLEVPPVRRYESGWFPEERPEDVSAGLGRYFAELLVDRWDAGEISQEEWGYLRSVAAHPAHGEVTILARAPEIDVASTRWRTPFPDSLTIASLPFSRVGVVRSAAYARVGRAVVAAEEGRMEDAERELREMVSAGLLLADQGPSLLDNLVGAVMARTAARNLTELYRATGREDRAERMDWVLASAQNAARMVTEASGTGSVETRLRELPKVVQDEDARLGLRWEHFFHTNTVASCLNLHTAVFGPGESYEEWLEASREDLVQGPGDEALFELGRRGYLGTAPTGAVARVIGGVFSLTLGGGSDLTSCSVLINALD